MSFRYVFNINYSLKFSKQSYLRFEDKEKSEIFEFFEDPFFPNSWNPFIPTGSENRMECRPAGRFFPWRNNKRDQARCFFEDRPFDKEEKKLGKIRKETKAICCERKHFRLLERLPFLRKLMHTLTKQV